MSYAALFPGQGSQFVGMGAELFEMRSDLLVEVADEVLGWSLRDVCLTGPEDLLTRTDRAQPALFALSYVLWEEMRAAGAPPPSALAGHSLGEYTALAAAGALSYSDGLALVAKRGAAMAAAAVASEPATMAAVVGSPDDVVLDVLARRREGGGRIWAANFNAPGQLVVAGAQADIDWLVESAREIGLRRVIPLTVGGAFHSPYMEPATEELATAVAAATFSEPVAPVYANVLAAPADDVAASLVTQLTSPVRFVESLEAMAASGVEAFVHVGPGDVTAGLAKKTVKGSVVITVSEVGDLADAAAQLRADENDG